MPTVDIQRLQASSEWTQQDIPGYHGRNQFTVCGYRNANKLTYLGDLGMTSFSENLSQTVTLRKRALSEDRRPQIVKKNVYTCA